ncbi:MAG: winged helix-turn-helix transcriptional regulator [Ruminococcus sp.]|nr:winged helix-turn-helix transcriptional regulator [Ruminococcus sp.]
MTEEAYNRNIVDKLRTEMPDDESLYDLAELFKVFGDTTRIRILYALLESELCVGDLADFLGLTQTACSHQLRVLKNNKLVRFRREGKAMIYSLSDDHVKSILEKGMEHVEE